MSNSRAKLAVAAVVSAATVLGLYLLIDTGATTGVVWADVVQKVQASRGVIYREKIVNNKYAHSSDYAIIHLSPTQYRSEGYRSGEPWITMYDDREALKRVVLLHNKKAYVKEKIKPTKERDQRHADAMDPRRWVERFLACEHSLLGQKVVDGVLCEGIKTTDPKLAGEGAEQLQIESLAATLWVDVQTAYPVLLEGEFDGKYSGNMVFDQFQWDVELDAGVFEPNIPEDYEQM